ncbi:MAG: DNA-3-methyladenine glycosylase [Bacteroidota bacterium]
MHILDRTYFARPTLEVARDLVGTLLVHETGGERIVETEGYTRDDPALHGWKVARLRSLRPVDNESLGSYTEVVTVLPVSVYTP